MPVKPQPRALYPFFKADSPIPSHSNPLMFKGERCEFLSTAGVLRQKMRFTNY
jgi:hypothetical protein